MIRSGFCLLLFSSMPMLASAEIIETLTFQDYDVRADGERSLLAAINKASPASEGGRMFHGYTKWYVRWNYRWNFEGNGACRISSSTISVTGNVLLPKLVGGTGAQKERFDRYLASLRTHELGHFDMGKRAAAAIDAFLSSQGLKSSCAVLERESNAGAYRILEQYKQAEKQYDIDTGHGRTQGAWLSE